MISNWFDTPSSSAKNEEEMLNSSSTNNGTSKKSYHCYCIIGGIIIIGVVTSVMLIIVLATTGIVASSFPTELPPPTSYPSFSSFHHSDVPSLAPTAFRSESPSLKTTQSQQPSELPSSSPTSSFIIRKVALGTFHTCAIRGEDNDISKNVLFCWGSNEYGQIGDNSTTDQLMPVVSAEVLLGSGLTDYSVDLAVGGHHTCIITNVGRLYCWGRNDKGQLGIGTRTNLPEPSPKELILGNSGQSAKKVALGAWGHSCAITENNDLYCWGRNLSGEVGDGTRTFARPSPTLINIGSSSLLNQEEYAVDISLGGPHTCALTNFNNLKCWGRNHYGQLGNGSTEDSSTPITINRGIYLGFRDFYVKAISTGGYHTCAITLQDYLICWGLNLTGQLGDGTTTDRDVPKIIEIDSSSNSTGTTKVAKKISLGFFHTCAITNHKYGVSYNELWCWGSDGLGQLGDGKSDKSIGYRSIPTLINTIEAEFNQVYLGGGSHSCAIAKNNRKLLCWGYNEYGGIGDNSTTNRHTPTVILNY